MARIILVVAALILVWLALRAMQGQKRRRPSAFNKPEPTPGGPVSKPAMRRHLSLVGENDPFRHVVFPENRPGGSWVNWKIGSGWFELAGAQHRLSDAKRFLEAAEFAADRGNPFGLRLERDPGNTHDPNAVRVIGCIEEEAAPGTMIHIGFVPRDVAAEVAKLHPDMPISAELKKAAIGESHVYITAAGLIPPVKTRREKGWEKIPPKAPGRIDLGQEEILQLEDLIARMDEKEPLSGKELERIRKAHMPDYIADPEGARRLVEEIASEEKPLAHLHLPDGEREAFMRKADNDLREQVSIVGKSFDYWLKAGEIPAPYYPYRIAVILRKAGRKDLEKRFLQAWLKHFPEGNGSRYGKLAERGEKLGIGSKKA